MNIDTEIKKVKRNIVHLCVLQRMGDDSVAVTKLLRRYRRELKKLLLRKG